MLRLSAWQSTCCSEAIQHHLGPLKHNYAYLPIVTGYIAKELGIRWQYHISCFVLCNMLQDTKGIITTLGRDGSDLTATVIGAAVKAAEVQIWKDVSGVQTTDPRVISSAKPATWSCWVGELWCCKNLFSHLDEVTNSVMERLYNWSWQWHGPSKLKYSKCWALSFLCLDLMVNQPRCECWHSKKPPSCRPLVQRLCTPLQCFLLGKPECQWACGIPWRRKIQVSLVFSVSAVLAVWTTDVILTCKSSCRHTNCPQALQHWHQRKTCSSHKQQEQYYYDCSLVAALFLMCFCCGATLTWWTTAAYWTYIFFKPVSIEQHGKGNVYTRNLFKTHSSKFHVKNAKICLSNLNPADPSHCTEVIKSSPSLSWPSSVFVHELHERKQICHGHWLSPSADFALKADPTFGIVKNSSQTGLQVECLGSMVFWPTCSQSSTSLQHPWMSLPPLKWQCLWLSMKAGYWVEFSCSLVNSLMTLHICHKQRLIKVFLQWCDGAGYEDAWRL